MLFNAMKNLFTLLIFSLCLLTVNLARAEQKHVLGPWDVHYIAVNTTFLTPEIAKANGIVRSKYNALINISVLDSDTQKAQLVAMQGEATNLLGNRRPLSFKRVQEGEAIYYLAVIPFRDKETLRFNIAIQQGNTKQNLAFQQTMAVD